MTRIIAGRAGGRSIATPRGASTRPTTDRVREAVFSRLEALIDLDDTRVLDLYAGSGALGLEAVSRGAAHLLAVEKHRPTAALVQRNAADLGFTSSVEVRNASVARVLEGGPGEGGGYHVVFLDPPYPLPEAELGTVLELLVSQGWLDPEAVVVVERSARSPEPAWPEGMEHLGTRSYGETAVHVAEPARHTED
ncbi:16S rRNA (guanine(966)-N(2))-methyltransferase RsmD [Ornithinimicrobium humiphilum]|uniref:16S rRNA (Guanine966-N2)-methyltransferase n=1 Tax=Ornithinimicrobium humiphilum TaxID=125288 RepID=A0A543KQB9_9MICO|nr:16S rRNA (guanine(966)-N(2))-methyltransferase RsmD [Ornithinimicrobium humiphilum]TQM97279.1 16S rRNA (guanine966-N2)-methyltransferase [Ornithinimicrobium humiphilum]